MTRDDAKKLIMVISTAYPNFRPDNVSRTVDVWASILSDKDYGVMAAALRAYILSDRSGFAPTIGQLIGLVTDHADDAVTEAEAWAMVCRAMRNSAYGAAEEYERLPLTIRKAVGSADQLRQWGLDDDFNQGVAQSHFLRAYRAEVERDKMNAAIGQTTLHLLSQKQREQICGT